LYFVTIFFANDFIRLGAILMYFDNFCLADLPYGTYESQFLKAKDAIKTMFARDGSVSLQNGM